MFCWETFNSGIYVDVSLINTIHWNFAANWATCWWQQPPSAGECTVPHWKLLKNNPGNTAKSIFLLRHFILQWKLKIWNENSVNTLWTLGKGREGELPLYRRRFWTCSGKECGKKKEEAQKSGPKGEQEFMSPAQCSTQSYKHYA